MRIVARSTQILREEGTKAFIEQSCDFIHRSVLNKTYEIGDSRECPICGFTGRKFKTSGNQPRLEAKCPSCKSRERHRLLWCYLTNKTNIPNGRNKDILYVSPIEPIERQLRSIGHNVVTIDLKHEEDVFADLTRLPFRESSFDVVICSHVLEHIPRDQLAIEEMYRVLRAKGNAFIIIPKDKDRSETYEDPTIESPEERERKFGSKNHVRWYGTDFSERLKDGGFEVSVETYAADLDRQRIERYGLEKHTPYFDREYKYEDIHICIK